jgi:hypothetical protein
MTNPQDMFPTRVYVSRPVTGSIQLGNILLGSGDAFDRIYFDLGQIFGLAPIPATVIISVRDSTLAEVQVDGVDVQEAGISVVTFMRDSDALDPSMPTTLGTSGKSYWLLNVPPGSAEVSATSHGAWQVDTAQISVIESELIFVLLIADPLPSGQTQPQTPPPPSPPSPSEGQDITVGGQPTALAFDGSNVWIATQTDNSVWVLSANDGSHLATFPITGTPYAMVSTANSTWIGSAEAPGQGYLTQANSSGIIRTFALQQEPMALTAVPQDGMPDPVIFFVDAIGDRLWRFDPGTGFANAVISTSTGAAEWDLWDLLFDGVSIWITDAANNTVAQLNPSGSIVLNTLPTGL